MSRRVYITERHLEIVVRVNIDRTKSRQYRLANVGARYRKIFINNQDYTMKRVLVLVLLIVLAACVIAETVQSSKQSITSDDNDDDYDDDDDDDDDDEDYDYQLEKGPHKHKHKYNLLLPRNSGFSTVYLPQHGLLIAGGLKSLAAFVAIKIKIILIVIAVIGVIGFILKVFGAFKYAGYLWNDCPAIHEPAYGYSAVAPPEHIDYGSYGHDWSSAEKYARGLLNDYVVDNTGFANSILKRLDMAEMMFSILDVDTDQCRRRLVCEIDAKARKTPFLEYAMQLFSRGFENYRTKDSMAKFEECGKLYAECTEYGQKSNRRRRRRRRRRRSVYEKQQEEYRKSL